MTGATLPLTSLADLLSSHCAHTSVALDADAAARLCALLPDWTLANEQLVRRYSFPNYHRTIDYVNALANLSHAEDHHPELTVTYNTCIVRYATHSVNQGQGGLSDNDFICAAKASALYQADQADHAAAVQP